MTEEALESVLSRLASKISIVEKYRDDVTVQALITSFKRRKRYAFDPEVLFTELRQIEIDTGFGAFTLEGTSGIEEANEARTKVRGARSRVVTMSQWLRDVHLGASRVLRVGSVWLRTQEDMRALPAKLSDDVVILTLREIYEVVESTKVIQEQVKEALVSIDDKSRSLDAWFNLHKQYIFLNYGKKNDGDSEENTTRRPTRR